MRITAIRKCEGPCKAVDCFVGDGYTQGDAGSLADIDIDYQADRRDEVKQYLRDRYNTNGLQRVFNAGTFTTMKLKAAIKDVARTMRIQVSLVNYITAIIDNDIETFADFFKLAASNRKVANFVQTYPLLFERVRDLLNQPRSGSVHASAILVTPAQLDGETMECFDYTPIKKVDGVLVSEWSGYSLDEIGLLKNDCLSIKELTQTQQTIKICNEVYNAGLTFEKLSMGDMDDPKVYELMRNGFTMNVFQFGSAGITRYLKDMRPTEFNDLVAASALYRPGALSTGGADDYVNRKNGFVAPEYLWGTYEILGDTYGVCIYQEQCMQLAQKIGGFSLGEGYKLVKFLSKKKKDKIHAMKGTFIKNAIAQGCPENHAESIWALIEGAGSYSFNRSHAVSYTALSYIGAYLKANYPTPFYTTSLQEADDKDIAPLMAEMEVCSKARVIIPDINHSRAVFFTDYSTDEIFWSLSKIKMLGTKAVDWIINERDKNGPFSGIVNFVDRVFKYKLKRYQYWDDPDNEEEAVRCPVNARHIRNLILAGCFDKVEKIKDVCQRMDILKKAAGVLGFEIKPEEFPADLIDKHYFWSQQQIKVSGIGKVDYRKAWSSSNVRAHSKGSPWITLKAASDLENEGVRGGFCATVVDVEEKKFLSKKTNQNESFCKILLQQDNDTIELVLWSEEYYPIKDRIVSAKGKLLCCVAKAKFSEFTKKNELYLTKTRNIEII